MNDSIFYFDNLQIYKEVVFGWFGRVVAYLWQFRIKVFIDKFKQSLRLNCFLFLFKKLESRNRSKFRKSKRGNIIQFMLKFFICWFLGQDYGKEVGECRFQVVLMRFRNYYFFIYQWIDFYYCKFELVQLQDGEFNIIYFSVFREGQRRKFINIFRDSVIYYQ